MNSMRDPLNTDHHHLIGNKLASTHHTALAMASTLQPLQRSVDSKHRLEVHTVSDTSSPESVGKNRPGCRCSQQGCHLDIKQKMASINQRKRESHVHANRRLKLSFYPRRPVISFDTGLCVV